MEFKFAWHGIQERTFKRWVIKFNTIKYNIYLISDSAREIKVGINGQTFVCVTLLIDVQ